MHTGPRDDELEHSLGLLHDAVLAATKRIHQDTSLKEDMGGLKSQLQQHRALDALVERMHGFSLLRARSPLFFVLSSAPGFRTDTMFATRLPTPASQSKCCEGKR
jgi:hypothetical protein